VICDVGSFPQAVGDIAALYRNVLSCFSYQVHLTSLARSFRLGALRQHNKQNLPFAALRFNFCRLSAQSRLCVRISSVVIANHSSWRSQFAISWLIWRYRRTRLLGCAACGSVAVVCGLYAVWSVVSMFRGDDDDDFTPGSRWEELAFQCAIIYDANRRTFETMWFLSQCCSSKLASLFGAGKSSQEGNTSLTYTAPKQPKKGQVESQSVKGQVIGQAGGQTVSSAAKLSIIAVKAVHTYKL
jgi:hypothetical protein